MTSLEDSGALDVFRPLKRVLAIEPAPAQLLTARGRVIFVNDAWDAAARLGGAAAETESATLTGRSWLEGIAGDAPRQAYARLLATALTARSREKEGAIIHLCEANGPDVARLIATRLEPVIAPGSPNPVGVAIVWAVLRQSPIAEVHARVELDLQRQRGPDGRVHQCTSCRRVVTVASEWVFVPELVARPPEGTSWDICAPCRDLYYDPPGGRA
jgi:hypothetical protein